MRKDRTCLQVALEPFADLQALEQDIEHIGVALARAEMQEETARLLEALGETQHRFEEGGGYTYRAHAAATLGGLGLPEGVWGAPVGSLSAGQKVRLALARLLLEEHRDPGDRDAGPEGDDAMIDTGLRGRVVLVTGANHGIGAVAFHKISQQTLPKL